MEEPTRITLIVCIRDPEDTAAWDQFVEIYCPMIEGYARRRGLQEADAADVTQEVLLAVSRTIRGFDYDPSVGRFRNWLLGIARHHVCGCQRKLMRQLPMDRQVGSGPLLEQIAADDPIDEVWEQEYRQHLFRWASRHVRRQVNERTWTAFWRTAVEGRPPAEVAEELGLSVGSVYLAKSRVTTRLRDRVAAIDDGL